MFASTTKIKRSLNAVLNASDLEYKIKNVRLNGKMHGCYGCITYKPTRVTVYISSDFMTVQNKDNEIVVRYAKDINDFTALSNNHFTDDNHIGELIKKMLLNTKRYNDKRECHWLR